MAGFFDKRREKGLERRLFSEGRKALFLREEALLFGQTLRTVNGWELWTCSEYCTPGGTHPGVYREAYIPGGTHPGVYREVYTT